MPDDVTPTSVPETDTPPGRRLGNPSRSLGWTLSVQFADLVLPLVTYYALRAFGTSVWTALVIPSLLTGLLILIRWAWSCRIDALSAFVLATVAVSAAVSAWSGNPRFLLARGALFTAVTAAVFLVSLLIRRPFAFSLARGLIERSQIQTADWDHLWHTQAPFRRAWQMCTAIWGVGLLINAVILTIFAYQLPIDTVPAAASALRIGTFIVLQIVTNLDLNRRRIWTMLNLDLRSPWRQRERPLK
jgi:intracellular septation protein A